MSINSLFSEYSSVVKDKRINNNHYEEKHVEKERGINEFEVCETDFSHCSADAILGASDT